MLSVDPQVLHLRGAKVALGADERRVTTHVVAQWAMQRQLEALARSSSVGLYLDLPVGVNGDAIGSGADRFGQRLAPGVVSAVGDTDPVDGAEHDRKPAFPSHLVACAA